MRIFDFVHKRVYIKVVDLTLFYVFSIAVFSFLAYSIFAWFGVYDCKKPFEVFEYEADKANILYLEPFFGGLRMHLEGKALRILWHDKIILPDDQGNFELLF